MSGVTEEMIEAATKAFWQWHGAGHAAAQRALLTAVLPLIRNEVLEEAATHFDEDRLPWHESAAAALRKMKG